MNIHQKILMRAHKGLEMYVGVAVSTAANEMAKETKSLKKKAKIRKAELHILHYIEKAIQGYLTVAAWLSREHGIEARSYELKEYRKAWIDQMIRQYEGYPNPIGYNP